jgi:PAS domain S-box-containing protein
MDSGSRIVDRSSGGRELDMRSLQGIAKFFPVVPDPMLLVDSSGCIVLVNEHTRRLFGYQPGELEGKTVACLLPERFRAAHGKHLEGYFRAPTVRAMGTGMELSARRSDDSEFPVEISLSPFRASSQLYSLAAIRDISERKRLEAARQSIQREKEIAEERARAAQALASRNEALRAIFDASPLGIVTTTQDGAIARWNRAAERIYGYEAGEVLGKSVWEMHLELEAEPGAPATAVLAEVRSGKELRNFQLRQRRKDGALIDVSLSSAPFHDSNGGNSGFVFMVDDISAGKAVEQQLRQSQKMEAVGQLTGGIAHDFNNLLSIVICNLELLQEKLPLGSEDRELTEMALDAGLHGAELVKQILAFSRKQNLDPQKIDVNDLIRNMTTLLARSLGEQIEILLELESNLRPAIADRVQLQTAVVNLATNARDAMPNGGRLVIQTENSELDEAYAQQFPELMAGEYVMVAVTDTGAGMDAETVERAFDPFFTTKPPGQGTGLGLSMVFGFVKQSGGHVRIYSEVGHGTTVRLYLPKSASEQLASAPVPGIAKKRKVKAARILIVEDNKDLAKSATRLLRDAGYEATVATDAEEAMENLRSGAPFDVLFTDIILTHGANGIELAQEATKLRPGIKVLFSSGFSEAVLRASGKAVVSGHFIAKPYRKDELIARFMALTEDGTPNG